jgi:GntR family transcriptional regulator
MLAKHAAIEQDLAARIARGELRPGQRLPAERELAAAHRVSRMTVRQALGALAGRGLIERGVGRGTFVADPRVAHDLSRVAGFSDVLRRHGMAPGARVRDARRVALAPAPLDGPAWRVQRVRTGDGMPLALEDSWLPAGLLPDLDRHDLTGSLYALLRDAYGLELVGATEALEAATATAAEARLLRVERGAPLMLVERVVRTADGTVVEVARDRFRDARFTVEVPGRVLADA